MYSSALGRFGVPAWWRIMWTALTVAPVLDEREIRRVVASRTRDHRGARGGADPPSGAKYGCVPDAGDVPRSSCGSKSQPSTRASSSSEGKPFDKGQRSATAATIRIAL